MNESEVFDKVKGMIIGCALGDALGAPHEFKHSKNIYTGNLKYKLAIKTGSYYKRVIKTGVIGQFTDDTELTLILLDQIIEGYNKDLVIMKYIKWVNDNTYFMGRNTRSLFKGIKTLRGYYNRIKKKKLAPQDEWTQSNGALMRCSPLSLLNEKYVTQDCEITNPSKICIDTNIYYTRMIRKYFGKHLEEYKYDKNVENVVREAKNKKTRNLDGKSKGWCLHGLYCAVYCDEHFNNYKNAIDWIINQKGDTDTNAAIAGAMLGAKYGFKKIYQCEKENIDILLNADTDKGDIPRSYNLKDIDNKCLILAKRML